MSLIIISSVAFSSWKNSQREIGGLEVVFFDDQHDFLNVENNGKNIADLLTEMIAKIGENLIISDLKVFDNKKANVNYYIHNPYRKNIGKIVSAIFYSSDEDNDDVKNFSKNAFINL